MNLLSVKDPPTLTIILVCFWDADVDGLIWEDNPAVDRENVELHFLHCLLKMSECECVCVSLIELLLIIIYSFFDCSSSF